MDLTQIIYSSMLIIFTLLALILIVSSACSKMSFCKKNRSKSISTVTGYSVSEGILPIFDKSENENLLENDEIVYSNSVVEEPNLFIVPEEELVVNNMNDYQGEYEFYREEIMSNSYQNSNLRYSVVNSMASCQVSQGCLEKLA